MTKKQGSATTKSWQKPKTSKRSSNQAERTARASRTRLKERILSTEARIALIESHLGYQYSAKEIVLDEQEEDIN